MNLPELKTVITATLDQHVPVISGACSCGSRIYHDGNVFNLHEHQAQMIVVAIMSEGTGIAPNEQHLAEIREGWGG